MEIFIRNLNLIIIFFVIGAIMKLLRLVTMPWLDIMTLSVLFYLFFCLYDFIRNRKPKQ